MNVCQKVLDICETAYFSHKPILYINTDEARLIYEIVASETMLETRRYGSMLDESASIVQPWLRNADSGQLSAREYPIIVTKWAKTLTDEQIDDLREYILLYQRMLIGAASADEAKRGKYITQSLIILYGTCLELPPDFDEYVEFIDVPLPEDGEIREIVKSEIEKSGASAENVPMQELVPLFRGFTCSHIHSLTRKIQSSAKSGLLDKALVSKALRADKAQYVKKQGILRLDMSNDELADIGGLGRLLEWIRRVNKPINNSQQYLADWGVSPPKGMLLSGVPGTGKSLAAIKTARELGDLPLLRMDIGELMGEFVGVSERNMRAAIDIIESMAPCVVLVDELDKGFSAVRKSGADSSDSTFQRMFGTFLTWMQQNRKPCFIVATANDLTGFPSEFFRNGRFDMAFAFHMPSRAECVDILLTHMREIQKQAYNTNCALARIRAGLAPDEFETSDEKRKLDERKSMRGFVFDINQMLSADYASKLIDLCIKDAQRPRFVTGADIKALLNVALLDLSESGNCEAHNVTPEALKAAFERALTNTRTYGDNIENLKTIARIHASLAQSGFISAAKENIYDINNPQNAYDRALIKHINEARQ